MTPIDQYRLDNGLRVVLNEDHSAPLVAVNLWYHVGSKNEREGRTGFAHLFEHMLFSGSENVGNNDHFRHVQSVGGTLNGTTFFDRTNYYETLPSNYLALALWLESDRMGFFLPALTQEKLDVQKNVVQEERRLRYDNAPYGTWFEELLWLAFEPEFPYHWPTIGSMADIAAAELDDIREFFRAFYGPKNATLTIVGDFEPKEARKQVETWFGSIPSGPPVEPVTTPRRSAASESRKRIESEVQLPRLYRLYHLPPMGTADWVTADVVAGALASGKASRLDRALVYEKKIAQDVGVFVLPTELAGMMIVSATAKGGVSIDDLETELDRELEAIAVQPLSADEVERSVNQASTDFAHQIEQYENRADLIGMFSTFFDEPRLVSSWLERYRRVGEPDAAAFLGTYLAPENRVTVQFVPSGTEERRDE